MLTQNMAENRFRVLDESEIEAVSGGAETSAENVKEDVEIVVEGVRLSGHTGGGGGGGVTAR